MMKEKPILFSGPMVKAILSGQKTQTRRVISPALPAWAHLKFEYGQLTHYQRLGGYWNEVKRWKSPYGAVGDHLWILETYCNICAGDPCLRADIGDICPISANPARWKASIHMPRKLSRITLEVTDVRVERLQKIKENDAQAEGVEKNWCGDLKTGLNGHGGEGWIPECGWKNYSEDTDGQECFSAAESYKTLWDKLNAKKNGHLWVDDPWVWVVDFKRIEG